MKSFRDSLLILFLIPASLGAFSLTPAKAALYSLILPGSGEIMLGYKTKGYLFLTAEATLILGAAGFKIHESQLLNDAKIFASQYAGADYNISDLNYWQMVEMYISRDAYIENLRREARRLYPDDPSMQEEYVESHAIEGEWNWSGKNRWFHYQDIRKSWREAGTRAKVALTLLVVNHLASFLDSYISGKLKNLSIETRTNGKRDYFVFVYRF